MNLKELSNKEIFELYMKSNYNQGRIFGYDYEAFYFPYKGVSYHDDERAFFDVIKNDILNSTFTEIMLDFTVTNEHFNRVFSKRISTRDDLIILDAFPVEFKNMVVNYLKKEDMASWLRL